MSQRRMGTSPGNAVGATANWLVVFESFIGPFVLVGLGALFIARLTRPRMELRFSESAVRLNRNAARLSGP